MHAYVLINRLTCVSVHTYTHVTPHPLFSELSVPLTKTNALSIPLTSRRYSRNTVQGLKALDPTGENALRTNSSKNREELSITFKVRNPSEENNATKSQPIGLTLPTSSPPPYIFTPHDYFHKSSILAQPPYFFSSSSSR